MTDVIRIVGERKLVKSDSTTETSSKTIQDTTETWETTKKGKGCKKVEIPLGGKVDAPTDDGISRPKTEEQLENLAKLAQAKEFMKTGDGKKLAQSLVEQDMEISKGQKKWLKKNGIDPEAFIQEWNKAHPESKNNKFRAASAAESAKEEMGTLANSHLGVDTEELPQNRADKKDIKVRNPKSRNFWQKLFTKKEKQVISDDKKYTEAGGSKVKLHSAQEAERNADYLNDVSDDIAKAGNEYLEAFDGNSNGKKRKTFKEIDENGNVVKTKVVYNKDGSAKKVVTKSKTDGKLVVKEAKDGDITVKGNLQSDFVYEKNADVKEIHTDRFKQDALFSTTTITNDYERTIVEKERCPEPPKPPVPPEKTPIRGGLVSDFVNDQNPNGMGNVEGSVIRTEFSEHGAAKMVSAYCSYTDENAPAQAKTMWSKAPGEMANKYNAEHIAQSLINDAETKNVNEKALGELITELRRSGNKAGLRGVKDAISRHNRNVEKLAPENRCYDEGTRTVNKPVSAAEIAVEWLMNNTKI